MNPNKLFIYLVLFLFTAPGFYKTDAAIITPELRSSPEKRKIEAGIDLINRVEKDLEPVIKPNVHILFDCKACHDKKAKTDNKAIKNIKIPEDIKLELCLTETNEVQMCSVCHPEKCFHPVGMDPKTLEFPMVIPKHLPLGERDLEGKIACSTCHNVHAANSMDQILRGFSESTGQETTLYKKREELCYDCHKLNLDNYDKPVSIIKHLHEFKKPDDTYNRSACKFCHIQENPEDANNIQDPSLKRAYIENNLRASITNICKYCHGENRNKIHYLDINPFADDFLETSGININSLLINNKFTCIACHDPHNIEKNRYHLRKQYILLGEKSTRISPHKKTDFCQSCHEVKIDDKSKIISNKFNGDWNKICNWCHETKEARAETHPVNIVLKENKKIIRPDAKEFPLTKEGKITCLTCHFGGNYGCDENKKYSVAEYELEGNTNRIRGWPYPAETSEERRWQLCLKCHIKGSFANFYIHYQIDRETRKIIESTCMFCHSSRPEAVIEGLKKPKLRAPVKFLCVSCHFKGHSGSRPSDTGMDFHRYKLKEVPGKIIIPKEIHISDKEAIHCATCHNPHQEGLIGGRNAPIKGEERKRFPNCTDCHINMR